MRKTFLQRTVLALGAVLLMALAWTGSILAHERRAVGDYQFVVGFMVEPAFEGEKNGVSLAVTRVGTGEPVEGLAETLQVEVTHEASGTTKVMDLRAVFGQPGSYAADFIPTEPGAYTFRFFGEIEGTEVDELFVPRSMGGGYNDVEASANIQFPEPLPSARELQNAVRGAQTAGTEAQMAAGAAQGRARTATILAVLGIVVGTAGVGAGVASAMAVRKR